MSVRERSILAVSCLVMTTALLITGAAPAQIILTPRIIQIDRLKCAELTSLAVDRQDRVLAYFNGYIDGMRQRKTWDEQAVGEQIERAVGYCQADPTETVLSAFMRAASR